MVKFLIIRFSSIGDIVLTTPVVRCLKNQVEESEVHFLTKKTYASIVEPNPYIDKVHLLSDSFSTTIEELKQEKFDYIIDLHHNLRTSIVKSKLKLVAFSFRKLNVEKWLKVNLKLDYLPKMHIVDRYLDTTQLFDVNNDHQGLDFFIKPEDEIDLNDLPDTYQKGFAAFVLGAKHTTKKLPTSKIISIIHKMDLPVILLGGREDEETGNSICESVKNNCLNAAGKYNLGQSASLIRQAQVVITHDTGLMHIAAAFHKKIISIWGNTIPEFGMYPYMPGDGSEIVEIKGLKCRPCSKIGFEKCPKKHFRCMNLIDEQQVATIANSTSPKNQ